MRAYAKVNLALNNLGKKGLLHKLDMIMSEINLFDEIEITINKNSSEINIFGMSGEKESNLMYKAAKAFLEYNNIEIGLDIYIEKNIPMEAGLGGGSSDAACVLKILSNKFRTNNTIKDLEKMAFKLGSDVPFFLYGGLCRVGGFGEVVRQISKGKIDNIVLVKPEYGLSTKLVFSESDKYDVLDKKNILDKLEKSIKKGKIDYELMFNDLEKAANDISKQMGEKSIIEYKEMLKECGAKIALMSGSGSAVFALCDGHAQEVYEKIQGYLKEEKVYKF